MESIKYNNLATVTFKSKAQCARFVAIVSRQSVASGCRIIHGERQASLLVPQDYNKAVQLDRMTGFKQAASFFVASEAATRKRKGSKTISRYALEQLEDVLDSFAPLYASDDTEATHNAADLLLCTALEALGQKAIVEAWRKVGKRYA